MAVPEDLSSWMGSLKDDIKLNKVVFPATHDSGMSFQSLAHSFPDVFNPLAGLTTVVTGALAIADDVRPKFLGGSKREHIKIFHDNFVTQGVKVGGQLAFGARQFDLRVTSHLGQLVTYHGHWAQSIIGMRRYGESWKSICKSIAEFMAANPTEFLVLKMDKQKPGKIFKKTELKKLIKTLTKALEKAGVKNHKKGELLNYWVDQATIKELRGRILLCSKAKTLKVWKPLVKNTCIQLCLWQKDTSGSHPKGTNMIDARISRHVPDAYPTYLLLGGARAKGDSDHKDRDSVLDKQEGMRDAFHKINRKGKAGLRGIWFNTFSYLRDIRTYSEEIWKRSNRRRRERLWLSGDARQNVASLDFLDDGMARYVLGKNPDSNWKA